MTLNNICSRTRHYMGQLRYIIYIRNITTRATRFAYYAVWKKDIWLLIFGWKWKILSQKLKKYVELFGFKSIFSDFLNNKNVTIVLNFIENFTRYIFLFFGPKLNILCQQLKSSGQKLKLWTKIKQLTKILKTESKDRYLGFFFG